jgi:hypothetical protein
MLRLRKKGLVVTASLVVANLVGNTILHFWSAWRDEQLAAAIHWLHGRYGAAWIGTYVSWASTNPVGATVIATCILIAGLYVVTFAHDRYLARQAVIPPAPDERRADVAVSRLPEVLPTTVRPNVRAGIPNIRSAFKDDNGGLHVGADPRGGSERFVVLAPFDNVPDKDHPKTRDAEISASVSIKSIPDFNVAGYWMGSNDRVIKLRSGAPAETLVLAFVIVHLGADLVGDERATMEGSLNFQRFWIGPASTIDVTDVVVKVVEAGELLLEKEYRLFLKGIPRVYLLE